MRGNDDEPAYFFMDRLFQFCIRYVFFYLLHVRARLGALRAGEPISRAGHA